MCINMNFLQALARSTAVKSCCQPFPLPRECLSFSSIFSPYVLPLSALINVENSLMTVNTGQFSEMSTRFVLLECEVDG